LEDISVAKTKKKVVKKADARKSVPINRRESDRRKQDEPIVVERRQKVQRRRQIDPTTCERDYTPEEVEFMQALDDYKRRSGRMFPTCSEILEVVKGMGFERVSQGGPVVLKEESAPLENSASIEDADLMNGLEE